MIHKFELNLIIFIYPCMHLTYLFMDYQKSPFYWLLSRNYTQEKASHKSNF